MVVSLLDPKLNYSETKQIHTDDVSHEVYIYEIPIYNSVYDVALGSTKYDYATQTILYIPIYLIVNNRVMEQIGLYEINGDNIAPFLDDDGDIDIIKMKQPLMFSYATKEYLQKKIKPENETDYDDDTSSTNESTQDITEQKVPLFAIPIPTQDQEQATKERKEYKYNKQDPWIRAFLKNPNINEVNNEGGGDCLFAVIRDAYALRGMEVSVQELREKLSNYATQEQFVYYRSQYEMYRDAIKEATASMKKLNKQNEELRKKLKSVSSREQQLKLVEESQQIKHTYEQEKENKKFSQELNNEFAFMKDIETLIDFKKVLLDSSYWADAWAISALEEILKIKLILFSEEAYQSEDMSNVLLCGESGNVVIDPTQYIMVSYSGNHYQLITFYEHGLLDFAHIPYDVKLLIVNKCMEKLAGPYYDIFAFREFRKKLGIKDDAEVDDNSHPNSDDEVLDSSYEKPSIVFQFYSNSSDKKKPGMGIGEKIDKDSIMRFTKLNAIKDWRRKLDNSWEQGFELDGHKWKSVEHFYNASKFIKNNPDYYEEFSLNSNSELSKDVAMAIAAGSSSGKYNKKQLRPIDKVPDEDFEIKINGRSRSQKELYRALEAKFTQNKDLQKLLIETQNAELYVFRRGKESERASELMEVRDKLLEKI